MMQQWEPEQQQQMSAGLGISEPSRYREPQQHQPIMHGLPLSVPADAFPTYAMAGNFGGDAFNSPEEMNRRTMTQEQFDAITRNGAMMSSSGDLNTYQDQFTGDVGGWGTVFPDMQGGDLKQQEAFAFPHSMGAPLSSYDSTVPSTIS